MLTAKISLNYLRPADAEPMIKPKAGRLSWADVFITLVESWLVALFLIGLLLTFIRESIPIPIPRLALADFAAVASAPYWCLMRSVIYDRCYPSKMLFFQALILCINYGYALGIAVLCADGPKL